MTLDPHRYARARSGERRLQPAVVGSLPTTLVLGQLPVLLRIVAPRFNETTE